MTPMVQDGATHRVRQTLSSAERKAVAATNFPEEHLANALRKFDRRVQHAQNDRLKAVMDARFWSGSPRHDGPPSSRGICGRERIFCCAIVYFEMLDEGHTSDSNNEMKTLALYIGSLIREHTRYEFPIAKLPDVAPAVNL